MTCSEHNWTRRFGGYCLECGMSLQEWVDSGGVMQSPRSEEDRELINLTEVQMGLNISAAGEWTREYLVPVPKPKTNGTA